jgi:hypothetical protein
MWNKLGIFIAFARVGDGSVLVVCIQGYGLHELADYKTYPEVQD